jgi:hypothetical protein
MHNMLAIKWPRDIDAQPSIEAEEFRASTRSPAGAGMKTHSGLSATSAKQHPLGNDIKILQFEPTRVMYTNSHFKLFK